MKKWLITTLLILSMSLFACQTPEEVVSSNPPDLGGNNTGEQATDNGAIDNNAAATEGTTGDAASAEGGEAVTAEGGEAAAEGGEAAAEGGEAATEGGEAATEGGEAAAEGGEAAAEGGEGGEAAATEGGEAVAEGGEAAAEGGEAAATEGGEAATEGGEAAAAEGGEGGEATTEGGEAAATEGGEAATDAGATTTSPDGEVTYTVQPGDTVGEIAQQFDVTITDIAAANELDNINNIKVGQALKIVAGAGGEEATPADVDPASEFDPDRYVTYIVSYGQTLFSIAQWYGFTVDELAAYNGITDPAQIKAGEVLRIPVR